MLDRHKVILDLPQSDEADSDESDSKSIAYFGLFDGHGGMYFLWLLKSLPSNAS